MGRVLKKQRAKSPRGPSRPPRSPRSKGGAQKQPGARGGFQRIVAQVDDVLYSVDAFTDEFVYLSPGFERLLGWTLDDVRHMGGRRAFLSRVIQDGKFEEQERLDREMKASPGPRAPIRCEAWWRCKDGTLKYLEDNWQPTYQDGRLLASDGVLRDLTERRRVEEDLRQSEARFLSAFDYASIGMALVGTDGRWLKVNHALCELTGYLETELLSKTFQDITHPDDLEKDLDYVRQMLAGTLRTYQMEKRYFHKRGHLIWVLLSVSLVRDPEGRPSYFISQIQDITARKEAEAAVRESEERYRVLVESSPDAISIQRDGRFLYANPAFLRLYGIPEGRDLAGLRNLDLVPVEDHDSVRKRFRRALEGEALPFRETRARRLDGTEVTIEGILRGVEFSGDQAVLAIVRDITERKRVEAALQVERDRAARYLDIAEVILVAFDDQARITLLNRKGHEVLGYKEGELLGKDWFRTCLPPEECEAVFGVYQKIMAGDLKPFEYYENLVVTKRGERRCIAWHNSLLKDERGRIVGTLSSGEDITERKQAEEALRESESILRSFFDSPSMMRGIVELVGDRIRILTANATAATVLYGRSAKEVLNHMSSELGVPGEIEQMLVGRYLESKRTGHPVRFEYDRRIRNADLRLRAAVSYLGEGAAGHPRFAYSIEDITEFRRAEQELAAERERLAVTLRSIGDAVITTDREGRVVFMNRVAEDLTGWSQDRAVGRSLHEVFHIINEKTGVRCEDPVAKVLATGGIVGLANHTALICRNGTQRIIEDSGAPIRDRDSRIIGVVLVFRDVTEKHRMQEEMLRANRLDSLGILAGGIAHDFNNILTIIMGNTSLAMMTSPPQDRLQKQLVETEKACLRAKDLTEQLLTFSKGGTPVRKTASLPDLIRESVDFALRGSPIKCHYGFAQDLWAAEVDSTQISRVFSNLAINSAQAMPSGGDFAVRARNLELKTGTALPLSPGRYVEIAFVDQGIGIPPEHLARVFDPFFTTKQQGSGLGLSICYSVISRHEGHISVESEMGKGSTFRILLPATGQKPSGAVLEAPVAGRFRGRLLVMDDEEAVRDVAATMLSALGCEVEVAADGARAVELYRQARIGGRPFDAVLMDLTVPGGMGGKEATRHLLSLDPYVRVVASSGYSTDPVMAAPRSHGFRATIAKPYTVPELARVLASVLES